VGPKPRTLLAQLALTADGVVSVERIIEALWGLDAADRTRASVHTYLSTLRRILPLRDLSTTLEGLGRRQDAERAWARALATFELNGSREAREPRRRYVAPTVVKGSASRS
jgi:DNA-binding SARP family transcriptional activator